MKKPVVLVITHVIPYPPSAGNEIRILNMLSWLRSVGYYTVLLLNHRPQVEVQNGLLGVVDEVHIAADYTPSKQFTGDLLYNFLNIVNKNTFLKFICESIKILDSLNYKLEAKNTRRWLCPPELLIATEILSQKLRPEVVIAEYIFTADCLDAVPADVLKVIDTHDMFSRKKEQVQKFGIRDLLSCTPRQERALLLKTDVIIAIQSNEAALFKRLVPKREVITVGIDFEVWPHPHEEVDPATILVVGSESPLNVHGLKEFYRHAWPEIRNRQQSALLKIIGKLGKHIDTEDPTVIRAGWVESLDDEYRKATVVINPIPSGTGLKIKSVEALCRGKALVSTINGVEGLDVNEGEATPYVACATWGDFAEATVALLEAVELRKSLEQSAISYAREKFNTDNIYKPLRNALDGRESLQSEKIRKSQALGANTAEI